MLRGAPPKKFCSTQARKVVKTMRTFSEADTDTWRACATNFVDEACARRYLSTRCWMASRAAMAITKTIEWRMTLGLDDSSSGDSSESCHPSWVRGCNHWGWEEEGRPIRVSPVKDIDGRPIVVLTARRWPEEDDEWLHMLIYALEEAAFQLKEANKSSAERQDDPAKTCLDTWTWVVDMTGATLADAPTWQALRKMDDMLFAHYPGRLARAIFVNMPGLLRLPFALALGLLDAKSREKITVVDDERVKLEHFVNAADVIDLFESRKTEKKEGGEKQTMPCKETTMFSFGSLFKCIS